MAQSISYNLGEMHRAASGITGVYSSLTRQTDYPKVDDCGSRLVAETLDFFVQNLVDGLKKGDRRAEKLATGITESAADYGRTETANAQAVQNLIDSLKDVVSDE